MTSIDEFLAKKRQERTRGKLAGLAAEIQKLRDGNASYKEIAEYLELKHGITASRSGIQKHMKSAQGNRSENARSASLTTPLDVQGDAKPPPVMSGPSSSPENAPPADEAINGPSANSGSRIVEPEDAPSDHLLTRYDRNSPEHLAKVAALRQQRAQSKT